MFYETTADYFLYITSNRIIFILWKTTYLCVKIFKFLLSTPEITWWEIGLNKPTENKRRGWWTRSKIPDCLHPHKFVWFIYLGMKNNLESSTITPLKFIFSTENSHWIHYLRFLYSFFRYIFLVFLIHFYNDGKLLRTKFFNLTSDYTDTCCQIFDACKSVQTHPGFYQKTLLILSLSCRG